MYEDLVIELRAIESYGSTEISSYEAGLYADAIEGMNEIIGGLNETIKMYGKDAPCWVPVTERLPARHKNVLCCGARGGMFVGWFTNISVISDGKTIAYVHGGNGRYVTHWMSLPQPPKEGT